jgi:putative FmdB family regulatory protein
MPTYEYACSNGHRIEVTQRSDDPPPTTCDRCGAPLRKVFHPAGIVFKGSGFYATDSRSAGKKKDEKKEKAPSGSGESSGSGPEKGGEKKAEPKSGDKKSSEGKSST